MRQVQGTIEDAMLRQVIFQKN